MMHSLGEKRFASTFKELQVWQRSMDLATEIFLSSAKFPPVERYSLIDQIRRSSRSVCTNIAEAWRKRRYPASFIAKLSDAESEAAETQTWLEFCRRFGYLDDRAVEQLDQAYDGVLAQLVRMIDTAPHWCIPKK